MKKAITLFILAITAVSTAHASCCRPGFVYIGSGYSYSLKGDVKANPSFWDTTPEGYNARLSESEFYTLGFGYHIWCPLSVSFDITYRPHYEYKRFQDSDDTGTPGPLGQKVRHFDLSNLAFMFNAFLNKQGQYLRFCGIAPFVGAGVGLSYNTLSDFHSIVPNPGEEFAQARSLMTPHTETALAGQAMAGFVLCLSDRLTAEIGYRYLYGGKFRSNDYTLDVPGLMAGDPPLQAPAWTGTLQAHEAFLHFCYAL